MIYQNLGAQLPLISFAKLKRTNSIPNQLEKVQTRIALVIVKITTIYQFNSIDDNERKSKKLSENTRCTCLVVTPFISCQHLLTDYHTSQTNLTKETAL